MEKPCILSYRPWSPENLSWGDRARRAVYRRKYGQRLSLSDTLLSSVFGRIINAPPAQGKKRLLDVGCANGRILWLLRERGFQVTGVEMDREVAETTQSRLRLTVFLGLFEEVSLEPGAFDVILMSHFLERVYSPRDVLKKAFGLLDQGGVLVLELPNVRAAAADVLKDDLGSHMAPQHLSFFSPETLRRLAREAGFQRTEWGHSGELFLWLRALPWSLHVLRRRSLEGPGGWPPAGTVGGPWG